MASTVPGTTSNSQPVVPRYGHQALVVDQYMYLIGGRTAKPSSSAPPTVATSSPLSQLLRLDLSKSFAVTNPPYLTRTGDVTSTAAASSLGSLALSSCRPLGAVGADRSAVLRCMGGVDGTGQLPSSGNMADVMYFDADPKWAASNPTGLLPPPRTGHAVTFANGAYFLFGGSSAPSVAASPMAPVQSLANDMYKLNLASNVWEGVQGLGPGARAQFSMTSLRSQPNLLVAVGGVGAAGGLASMSDVWVFNSQIGTWKLYQATGTSPQPRRGHSACSIGEFIYVQGGTNAQGSVVYADMSALIYSSTTDSFSWAPIYTPSLTDYDQSRPDSSRFPVGRAFHQLSCSSRHIFISFGISSASVRTDTLVPTMAVFDTATDVRPIVNLHVYSLDDTPQGGWTLQYNPPPNKDFLYGEAVPTGAAGVTSGGNGDQGNGNGTGGGTGILSASFWTTPVIVGVAVGGATLLMAIIAAVYVISSRSARKKETRRLEQSAAVVAAARNRQSLAGSLGPATEDPRRRSSIVMAPAVAKNRASYGGGGGAHLAVQPPGYRSTSPGGSHPVSPASSSNASPYGYKNGDHYAPMPVRPVSAPVEYNNNPNYEYIPTPAMGHPPRRAPSPQYPAISGPELDVLYAGPMLPRANLAGTIVTRPVIRTVTPPPPTAADARSMRSHEMDVPIPRTTAAAAATAGAAFTGYNPPQQQQHKETHRTSYLPVSGDSPASSRDGSPLLLPRVVAPPTEPTPTAIKRVSYLPPSAMRPPSSMGSRPSTPTLPVPSLAGGESAASVTADGTPLVAAADHDDQVDVGQAWAVASAAIGGAYAAPRALMLGDAAIESSLPAPIAPVPTHVEGEVAAPARVSRRSSMASLASQESGVQFA